jgi:thiosulfate reductase cytochrome b subunit
MTIWTIAAGAIGLVLAMVLSTAAVFQSAAVPSLLSLATDRSYGLVVNARTAWSLAQLALTVLLVPVVAVASVAVTLGTHRAFRVLRIAVFAGAACSLATVVIHVAMVLPGARQGALTTLGTRVDLEVLTSLVALALQILLGAMLSGLHPSRPDRHGELMPARG